MVKLNYAQQQIALATAYNALKQVSVSVSNEFLSKELADLRMRVYALRDTDSEGEFIYGEHD